MSVLPITRRPLVTWGVTALILPFAVGLHAFIDAWVIGLYRTESEASFPQLFIGVFYLDATLLGQDGRVDERHRVMDEHLEHALERGQLENAHIVVGDLAQGLRLKRLDAEPDVFAHGCCPEC